MHVRGKPVVLYLLFVGIPLLGLIVVLQLGRLVRPTPSVDGKWRVDAQGQLATALMCRDSIPGNEQWLFDVTQSGQHVTLRLENARDVVLRGNLERGVVEASARQKDGSPAIRLNAQIEPPRAPQTLVGKLGIADCPAPDGDRAVEVDFRATRDQSPPEKKK
jgi:hypothetical protein